jgi:hypothetical protein
MEADEMIELFYYIGTLAQSGILELSTGADNAEDAAPQWTALWRHDLTEPRITAWGPSLYSAVSTLHTLAKDTLTPASPRVLDTGATGRIEVTDPRD